jgi:hypothetical protein
VQAAGEPELTSVDILADEVVQLEKQRDTLQAKLSAERARVDALAELVKDLARQQREDFQRMDFYEITVQELDRIMEGWA